MVGGRGRDRTGDPLLAKQVLSQLSYTPTVGTTFILKHFRRFQNPFLRFSREFMLRKQILNLKRVLANKTMEVDFFRRALQRVGARRRQGCASGGEVSTTK